MARGVSDVRPAPPSRPSIRRRIEDVLQAPTATGDDTPAQDHGAEGMGTQATPDHSGADSASSSRRTPAPEIRQPSIRITPEYRAAGTADAVRDALPLPLLADLIRNLSISISEADGAGERGWLSPIQSTQIAALLHDGTVDFVVRYFNGNVTRFKAALAVVVILASKGSVHARAIGVRINERGKPRQITQADAASAQGAPPAPSDPVAAPVYTNGAVPSFITPDARADYEAAMRRQSELVRQGVGELG